MSDHNERACTHCGSFLHHDDECSHAIRKLAELEAEDEPTPMTTDHTETPRTDEQWERHDHETIDEASARCRHFARTLERELTAAKRVRDEANARLVNSIKHLNRLGSWAQQDPTGPFESVQIQQWVLSELRAALGQDYEPTKWQPSILMLRDQLSAATRRAEEAERERDDYKRFYEQQLKGHHEANAKIYDLNMDLRQVQAERDEALKRCKELDAQATKFLEELKKKS